MKQFAEVHGDNDLNMALNDLIGRFELTNSCNEKLIVGVIYRHSKGSISDFTTSIENSVSTIINDETIEASVITGDFNIDLICTTL